jgi:hypothetical protein
MNNPETVPASEFTRNFGRYRMRAQREPVAVSSHGQITGYFVSPEEYEEFKRFRESRRSFATADFPDEKVEAIRTSRMDPRHAHLDKLLDPKERGRRIATTRIYDHRESRLRTVQHIEQLLWVTCLPGTLLSSSSLSFPAP